MNQGPLALIQTLKQTGRGLLLGAALLSPGCTNLFGIAGRLGTDTTFVSPTTGQGNTTIELSRVLQDTLRPSELLLLGNGTGQLGNLCIATSQGTSTCSCNYSYIKADGTSEQFDVPTTWTENNLIRCSFATVPKSIAYVNVRIHLTNSDVYSNTQKFWLSQASSYLDSTDPNSFAMPFRFQCRDSIFIPYAFPKIDSSQATVYDPILSEDPSIAFAFNYYSSNMYASANAFLRATAQYNTGGGGLICPATPNDSNFGSDLSVFSQADDSNGSNRIYPPQGSAFDRSTFYLARRPTGVFSLPVNAYTAPTVITAEPDDYSAPNSNPDLPPAPLGYGAAPIPQSDGTEKCPTTATIPPGFKWVKVFQFRASLPKRAVPSSDQFARSAISCNPGNWLPNNSTPVISACSNATLASSDDSILAGRAIYGPNGTGSAAATACMKVDLDPLTTCDDSWQGPGCTAQANGAQKSTYATWPTASDIWAWFSNPTQHCIGGAQNDFLGLCAFLGQGVAVPTDDDVQLTEIENASRYDFLLVVTPTTLHFKQMNDPSEAAANPYRPFRFYPGACPSNNPALCGGSTRIIYQLKSHDVNYNGDAPPDDPGRLPAYPLCALQPI